jgi:hypothetical protein
MLGCVLGMIVSSVLDGWARASDQDSLSDVLLMCSLLFEVALLFGLVRLLFSGLRWGGRVFTRRRRVTVPQDPPGSPGH